MIPYAKHTLDSSDIKAVSEALKGNWITRDSHVCAFEQDIASYCGSAHAIAFSSGTAAMHAAAFAAGVGPFDRLVAPAITYIGTVAGPLQLGAQLILADINPFTACMNLQELPDTSRGRTIYLPVHFGGIPIDMDTFGKRITDPDGVVIEDACHALGADAPSGGKVGSCARSDMTIFSFHPAKTITCGEGGMVTTNSADFAERLRLFRNNGMTPKGAVALSGNFHMNEMEAALGRSQLKKIDKLVERRRAFAQCYRMQLEAIPHMEMLGSEESDLLSSHHLCVARIDFDAYNTTRNEVQEKLLEKGIGTQVHYLPLDRHPIINGDPQPQADAYFEQALTLPLHPVLTEKEVTQICTQLVRCMP